MTPFFITGLPRSRTLWFSQYFMNMGVPCHHELLNRCRSRNMFYSTMERTWSGNSDCGLFLTDFQKRWPTAPTVVIHRPIDGVLASLSKIGIRCPRAPLEHAEEVNSAMSGIHVDYDQINDQLQTIHEYLVPVPYDPEYACRMTLINIQLSVESITGSPEAMAVWLEEPDAVS